MQTWWSVMTTAVERFVSVSKAVLGSILVEAEQMPLELV